VAWVVGLALVALHLDFWREQRVELYFGWCPEELLYRLAWMLAAWALLLWLCVPRQDARDGDGDGR
jgi:hypothetical protein